MRRMALALGDAGVGDAIEAALVEIHLVLRRKSAPVMDDLVLAIREKVEELLLEVRCRTTPAGSPYPACGAPINGEGSGTHRRETWHGSGCAGGTATRHARCSRRFSHRSPRARRRKEQYELEVIEDPALITPPLLRLIL